MTPLMLSVRLLVRNEAKVDLFARMADATGKVGQAASAIIPGLGEMNRGQMAQRRIDIDVEEKGKLEGLRSEAAQQATLAWSRSLMTGSTSLPSRSLRTRATRASSASSPLGSRLTTRLLSTTLRSN